MCGAYPLAYVMSYRGPDREHQYVRNSQLLERCASVAIKFLGAIRTLIPNITVQLDE